MKVEEICAWDSTEAMAEKKPKTYNNFCYDATCIDQFIAVGNKINEIKADVDAIKRSYTTIQTYYDKFTGFNDEMDANAKTLGNFVDNIEKFANKCLQSAIDAISDQVSKDISFQDDLDKLNQVLAKGALNEGSESDASFRH